MKLEWIDLQTSRDSHFPTTDFAMNVPGGMVLRVERANSTAFTFVPLVNVIKQDGQVGFVSVMAEAMQMSVATSIAAVNTLLDR